PEVRAAALAAARRIGARAHAGTYVALTGPTYETRAEYRMLRTIGADAVGMSTVPEAIMATHLQLRILALSIITNVAAPDVLETVSGEEVVAAAEAAGSHVQQVIAEILPQLDHLATP
ncbi:MAG: purine-nucleoside phosphorylase, partial [Pirellulaceae bacterium]